MNQVQNTSLHQRTTGYTPHSPSPPEDYRTHTTLPLSTRGLPDTHHTAPLHHRTTGHTPHCPSPPEDYRIHTTLPLSTIGLPDTHHTAPLHHRTTGHTPHSPSPPEDYRTHTTDASLPVQSCPFPLLVQVVHL